MGPGDLEVVFDHVHAAGWTVAEIPDSGDLFLSTPCQRVHLAFRPERRELPLWTITARTDPVSAAEWTAAFTECVPDEIVHALIRAITDDRSHGHDGFLQHRLPHADAWAPLVEQGWHVNETPFIVDVFTPDRLAGLVHRRRWNPAVESRASVPAWILHCGPGGSPLDWSATFTSGTPAHLIAAVTTALADPTPLHRSAHQLPFEHQQYLHTAPAPGRRAQAALLRTGPAPGSRTNEPATASHAAAPVTPAPRHR